MHRPILIAVAAAAFATGCEQPRDECSGACCDAAPTDTFCFPDTGDTDTGGDETIINSVTAKCEGTGVGGSDTWEISVEASGDGALFELDIVETGATVDNRWTESGHTSDAMMALALDTVETTEVDGIHYPQTGNVVIATSGQGTTAFNCNWDNGTSLAYKASLIDSTNAVADCVVWGYNATTDAFSGTSCICLDCG